MRFWTSMQLPICQAAYIDNGKIVKTVPTNSPRTPVRQITQVGEWDDKLLIGRRCSVEMWVADGSRQLASVYHPYMYGMHCLKQWREKLLLCSGQLDVIYLLDWDGNIHWEWWAADHGLTTKSDALEKPDWQVTQTSYGLVDKPDSTGMNSIHPLSGNELLVTFHRLRKVGRIDFNTGKLTLLENIPNIAALHDYQYDPDDGKPVYGHNTAIVTPEKIVSGYKFVRRIRCCGGGKYMFSHNGGMTVINSKGGRIDHVPVARPFDIAHVQD